LIGRQRPHCGAFSGVNAKGVPRCVATPSRTASVSAAAGTATAVAIALSAGSAAYVGVGPGVNLADLAMQSASEQD